MLCVNQITKDFVLPHGQKVNALQKISFSLQQGEILGLIGQSGSGKTTLARIIAGLEQPDSGTVIWQNGEKKKQFLVQMVFQNPYAALYRRMRVQDIIAEPLLLQKQRYTPDELAKKIRAALLEVRLEPEYGQRYPHQLSGGQKQRVALARALILQPALLIADEPTSMLDMSVQADILALLLQLKREKDLTVLLVTHDLSVADYLCDRILVLQDGCFTSPDHMRQLLDVAEKNNVDFI